MRSIPSILMSRCQQERSLTNTLSIQTEPLPQNIIHPNVKSTSTQPSTLSNLYLISDDNYHYLVDRAGDIRWIQYASSGSVTPLRNGTLLTYDLPSYYYYHQALIERNYLVSNVKTNVYFLVQVITL